MQAIASLTAKNFETVFEKLSRLYMKTENVFEKGRFLYTGGNDEKLNACNFICSWIISGV